MTRLHYTVDTPISMSTGRDASPLDDYELVDMHPGKIEDFKLFHSKGSDGHPGLVGLFRRREAKTTDEAKIPTRRTPAVHHQPLTTHARPNTLAAKAAAVVRQNVERLADINRKNREFYGKK